MATFTEKEFNENLKRQIRLAEKQDRIEEGEAALYSLIVVTCLILIVGSCLSIYKTLLGQ